MPAAYSHSIYDSATDGKATYSVASQGHCESISKTGNGIVAGGFEICRKGSNTNRSSPLCASSTARINSRGSRSNCGILNESAKNKKRKWHLGVKVHQISDEHKEQLTSYLARKKEGQPLVISRNSPCPVRYALEPLAKSGIRTQFGK